MNSFKFLAEVALKHWSSEDTPVASAIEFLNTHCKQGLEAISNGGLIYRGFTHEEKSTNFKVFDSTDSQRTSRDTNNLYQLGMDISPAFSGYPSRSSSFICSTSPGRASDYGAVYVMVPIDGTKIASLKVSDIFAAYLKTPFFEEADISDISDGFGETFSERNIRGQNKEKYTDATALDEALSKLTVEDLMIGFDEHLHIATDKQAKALTDLLTANTNKRFTALASVVFTPKTVGASLHEYGKELAQDKEVWFSGKAMAIPFALFAEMLNELKGAGFKIHKNIRDEWSVPMQDAVIRNSKKSKEK